MDQPFTKWYCDVCGESIEAAANGYVIWKPVDDHGFKIVHKKRCDQRDHISSKALPEFLGPEGLTYLLSKLSIGPILQDVDGAALHRRPNLDEYVDFTRRVQIPYYEEARRLFGTQRVMDDFHDANEHMPYWPDRLKRMIEAQEDDE